METPDSAMQTHGTWPTGLNLVRVVGDSVHGGSSYDPIEGLKEKTGSLTSAKSAS